MLVSNAAPAAPLDAARPADPRPVEALIDAISLRLGKIAFRPDPPEDFVVLKEGQITRRERKKAYYWWIDNVANHPDAATRFDSLQRARPGDHPVIVRQTTAYFDKSYIYKKRLIKEVEAVRRAADAQMAEQVRARGPKVVTWAHPTAKDPDADAAAAAAAQVVRKVQASVAICALVRGFLARKRTIKLAADIERAVVAQLEKAKQASWVEAHDMAERLLLQANEYTQAVFPSAWKVNQDRIDIIDAECLLETAFDGDSARWLSYCLDKLRAAVKKHEHDLEMSEPLTVCTYFPEGSYYCQESDQQRAVGKFTAFNWHSPDLVIPNCGFGFFCSNKEEAQASRRNALSIAREVGLLPFPSGEQTAIWDVDALCLKGVGFKDRDKDRLMLGTGKNCLHFGVPDTNGAWMPGVPQVVYFPLDDAACYKLNCTVSGDLEDFMITHGAESPLEYGFAPSTHWAGAIEHLNDEHCMESFGHQNFFTPYDPLFLHVQDARRQREELNNTFANIMSDGAYVFRVKVLLVVHAGFDEPMVWIYWPNGGLSDSPFVHRPDCGGGLRWNCLMLVPLRLCVLPPSDHKVYIDQNTVEVPCRIFRRGYADSGGYILTCSDLLTKLCERLGLGVEARPTPPPPQKQNSKSFDFAPSGIGPYGGLTRGERETASGEEFILCDGLGNRMHLQASTFGELDRSTTFYYWVSQLAAKGYLPMPSQPSNDALHELVCHPHYNVLNERAMEDLRSTEIAMRVLVECYTVDDPNDEQKQALDEAKAAHEKAKLAVEEAHNVPLLKKADSIWGAKTCADGCPCSFSFALANKALYNKALYGGNNGLFIARLMCMFCTGVDYYAALMLVFCKIVPGYVRDFKPLIQGIFRNLLADLGAERWPSATMRLYDTENSLCYVATIHSVIITVLRQQGPTPIEAFSGLLVDRQAPEKFILAHDVQEYKESYKLAGALDGTNEFERHHFHKKRPPRPPPKNRVPSKVPLGIPRQKRARSD